MRAADLAVLADVLEGEAHSLAVRLGAVRRRLREAAIEHEARRALPEEAVRRLEALGLLAVRDVEKDAAEAREIETSLAALGLLREWVRCELETAASERAASDRAAAALDARALRRV